MGGLSWISRNRNLRQIPRLLEVSTCTLTPEPKGGFTVTCPALPGVVALGETLEHARTDAEGAVADYLKRAKNIGELS